MPDYKITKHDVETVVAAHKPQQPIALDKLAKAAGLSLDRMYAVKRRMMHMGLMTEKRRRTGCVLVTLHNPALPKSERQLPVTRSRDNGHAVQACTSGDVFSIETTTTYTVTGGMFTAKQLETLARKVLRELGYTVTKP